MNSRHDPRKDFDSSSTNPRNDVEVVRSIPGWLLARTYGNQRTLRNAIVRRTGTATKLQPTQWVGGAIGCGRRNRMISCRGHRIF
jgi:hypothetical protein